MAGCFLAPPTVPVTGVTLDKATLALVAGGATGTLVETVAPADATDQSVDWDSSDEAVATVAAGVVTPLTAGLTVITVTTVDGSFNDNCVVTVTTATEPELQLTGIVVSPKTMELLGIGDAEQIEVTACYEVKGYEVELVDLTKCIFLTSDDEVATVSEGGLVTAEGEGEAVILVSYEGKVDTLEVTVTEKPVEMSVTGTIITTTTGTVTLHIVANDDADKIVKAYFTLPEGDYTFYAISSWSSPGPVTFEPGEDVVIGATIDSEGAGYPLDDGEIELQIAGAPTGNW